MARLTPNRNPRLALFENQSDLMTCRIRLFIMRGLSRQVFSSKSKQIQRYDFFLIEQQIGSNTMQSSLFPASFLQLIKGFRSVGRHFYSSIGKTFRLHSEERNDQAAFEFRPPKELVLGSDSYSPVMMYLRAYLPIVNLF